MRGILVGLGEQHAGDSIKCKERYFSMATKPFCIIKRFKLIAISIKNIVLNCV